MGVNIAGYIAEDRAVLADRENAEIAGIERIGADAARWEIGRLYPLAVVASGLGVPRSVLRQAIAAGRLTAFQPAGRNGKVLIGGGAVRDWLAACRVRAAAPAPASVGLPVIADRDRRLA